MTVHRRENNGDPKVLAAPTPLDVLAQLERITANQAFADCERSRQFLRYVVEETLAGRAGRIKGVTIANEVFGFDDPEQAQTSTVVRVEAGRLRRRLDLYYTMEGRADPIRIHIPKGSYVPSFEPLFAAQEGQREQPSSVLPEPPPWKRLVAPGPVHFGVLLTLVAAALLVWALLAFQKESYRPVPEVPSRPSIAVLPFEDSTTDAHGTELAAGLTEDITTDLSKLSGIDVIALSSVLPYRERKATLRQLRGELGVTHILYGRIRGTPEKLRVTAQLHETETGNQMWAGRFDRGLGDILALQDELAVKIVEGMAVGFRGDERDRLTSGRAANTEAHTLYKQALGMVNPPNDPGRLMAARGAFHRVIEMDPDFAGGYAGTAYTHAFAAFWGVSDSPTDEAREALELLEKAQELDPSFGLTYSSQAIAYMALREFEGALTASRKAIDAQPNNPYVSIYHAAVLLSSGQPKKGIEYAKRALRLDPLSARTPYLNILGMTYFHSGEYRKALDAFQRNIGRGGPFAAHIQAYVAATHALLGHESAARENLAALDRYKDGFSWKEWLQRWHKQQSEAERVLGPIRDLSDNPGNGG